MGCGVAGCWWGWVFAGSLDNGVVSTTCGGGEALNTPESDRDRGEQGEQGEGVGERPRPEGAPIVLETLGSEQAPVCSEGVCG